MSKANRFQTLYLVEANKAGGDRSTKTAFDSGFYRGACAADNGAFRDAAPIRMAGLDAQYYRLGWLAGFDDVCKKRGW